MRCRRRWNHPKANGVMRTLEVMASDRPLTMMMETIQTVMVVNHLLSVWRKAGNVVAIMNQLMTEDSDAFADHVDGDRR
jgi:hypothetical protein